MPPIERQVGLDIGVQGGQDAVRHGPHQVRDDLNRFTFLLGGSDGERLFSP